MQPQAPDPQTCAVLAGDPFILPVPEGCTRPATVGPWAGMEPKHVRLVGRFNGHLAVDHDLAGVHEQEVRRVFMAEPVVWLTKMPLLLAQRNEGANMVLSIDAFKT